MLKHLYLLPLLASLPLLSAQQDTQNNTQNEPKAVQFRYKHFPQQQYHIVAQVDEQVYRDRHLVYNTQILNRIAVKVTDIIDQNAALDVNYQISEQIEGGRVFNWLSESNAQFHMSPLGLYKNVEAQDGLPSLRNVPRFPDHALKPGEGWSAPGIEFQDLSQIFGIFGSLRFDFTAHYIYRGQELFEGRELQHISLFYNISEDVRRQLPNYRGQVSADRPRSVKAQHNIDLYWDSERGIPVYERENFEVSYLMESGSEVKFKGRSRGRVIEARPMVPETLKNELLRDINNAGIDADIREHEKGVSISIDSIKFYPDSDRMLPGEDRKLEQISKILKKYPDRDILITGHTADLGRPETQQLLSEKRAAAVGQTLIDNDVRKHEQIVTKGVGATQPVAPNNTEEGRRQNRRVEMTLLEN